MPRRALPGLARPVSHPWETARSYVHRLERRIGLGNGALWSMARVAAPQKTADVVQATLISMTEELTGRAVGSLAQAVDTSEHAVLGARLMCLECAEGEDVELLPHSGSHCCLEHGRWTGPEPTNWSENAGRHYEPPARGPWSSAPVGSDVLDADRTYRALHQNGRGSLALLAALVEILDAATGRGHRGGLVTPDNYVLGVAWLALLSDRAFHSSVFDPRLTFAQAHTVFLDHANKVIPSFDEMTDDRIWLLLRPTFAWIRARLLAAPLGVDFNPLIEVDLDDLPDPQDVVRPLEPFSRYLQGLNQPGAATQEGRESYLVVRQHPHGSHAAGGKLVLLCDEGHTTRRNHGKIAAALSAGKSPCPICTGRQALPGYNSLTETHPALAQEWDFDKNPGATPSQLVSGSNKKCAWRCHRGHTFDATVANRALNGSGCPVCSNQTVLPGVNDLATTHPELAAEWHLDLNGDLSPNEVIDGRRAQIAWLCPVGHGYTKTIAKRKAGQGCPICSGRKVRAGINDLATTHPHISSEWDPARNAQLTPSDVSAGSEKMVHWLCRRGHSYTSPVMNRTGSKKTGCPYCSSRQLLPGFNDLATQYPALARDWDPARNGGLTASEVMPGSVLRWWKCAAGHEQNMMFRNRLRAGGCTACSLEQRVGTAG